MVELALPKNSVVGTGKSWPKPAGAKKYIISYRDASGRRRKKTGTPDKAVSERIGRELENRVALRKEGGIESPITLPILSLSKRNKMSIEKAAVRLFNIVLPRRYYRGMTSWNKLFEFEEVTSVAVFE